MYRKLWTLLALLATAGLLALPAYSRDRPSSEATPGSSIAIETRTYINRGLQDLIRIDIHINVETRDAFGTYSVIRDYSDDEAGRVAYGFIGSIKGEEIRVSFGEALPYPVPPEIEDSRNAVWRFAYVGKGTEVVEIPTYGRKYDDDTDAPSWGPYVMRLERID